MLRFVDIVRQVTRIVCDVLYGFLRSLLIPGLCAYSRRTDQKCGILRDRQPDIVQIVLLIQDPCGPSVDQKITTVILQQENGRTSLFVDLSVRMQRDRIPVFDLDAVKQNDACACDPDAAVALQRSDPVDTRHGKREHTIVRTHFLSAAIEVHHGNVLPGHILPAFFAGPV